LIQNINVNILSAFDFGAFNSQPLSLLLLLSSLWESRRDPKRVPEQDEGQSQPVKIEIRF
jgi:hypothetical protein